MRKLRCICWSVAFCILFGTGRLTATICDLTTSGATCGPINGGFFQEVSPQPTGTGFIDPFLRLQAKGTEQGYNTSFRPLEIDEKEPLNFTHDLLLSAVPVVFFQGTAYREFFLDINQSVNHAPELSLDQLQIFLAPTGNRTGYPSGLGTKIYDLDDGGDNWIKLDYSLNNGSGSGDMRALIPDSLFNPALGSFVSLFSRFGDHHESNAGFEEWWARPVVSQVPEPSGLLQLGLGLLALGYVVRRQVA